MPAFAGRRVSLQHISDAGANESLFCQRAARGMVRDIGDGAQGGWARQVSFTQVPTLRVCAAGWAGGYFVKENRHAIWPGWLAVLSMQPFLDMYLVGTKHGSCVCVRATVEKVRVFLGAAFGVMCKKDGADEILVQKSR